MWELLAGFGFAFGTWGMALEGGFKWRDELVNLSALTATNTVAVWAIGMSL